jgi:hypothetical protein
VDRRACGPAAGRTTGSFAVPDRLRNYLAGAAHGVGGTLVIAWLLAHGRPLLAGREAPSGILLPAGSSLFIAGSLLVRKGRGSAS